MKPRTESEQERIVRIGATLNLSPRQSAVAALVHAELSDKEIAAAIGGSPLTVRSHLRQIYARVGARGRIGLSLGWERARLEDSPKRARRK